MTPTPTELDALIERLDAVSPLYAETYSADVAELCAEAITTLRALRDELATRAQPSPVPDGWRLCNLRLLANVLSMLPPQPLVSIGSTYRFEPPDPIGLLYKIKTAFDELLAASPPAPAEQGRRTMENPNEIATITLERREDGGLRVHGTGKLRGLILSGPDTAKTVEALSSAITTLLDYQKPKDTER